jgi:hypothetical protein
MFEPIGRAGPEKHYDPKREGSVEGLATLPEVVVRFVLTRVPNVRRLATIVNTSTDNSSTNCPVLTPRRSILLPNVAMRVSPIACSTVRCALVSASAFCAKTLCQSDRQAACYGDLAHEGPSVKPAVQPLRNRPERRIFPPRAAIKPHHTSGTWPSGLAVCICPWIGRKTRIWPCRPVSGRSCESDHPSSQESDL